MIPCTVKQLEQTSIISEEHIFVAYNFSIVKCQLFIFSLVLMSQKNVYKYIFSYIVPFSLQLKYFGTKNEENRK